MSAAPIFSPGVSCDRKGAFLTSAEGAGLGAGCDAGEVYSVRVASPIGSPKAKEQGYLPAGMVINGKNNRASQFYTACEGGANFPTRRCRPFHPARPLNCGLRFMHVFTGRLPRSFDFSFLYDRRDGGEFLDAISVGSW